uniref:Putative tail assembly chaperone n=1 Tax=viral metagenome TaxID=1070528 RepID=A0A6M3IYH5_9ZZZZ
MLTRDQILNIDDTKKELVPVPEWGGDVWVRNMSGKERDSFEEETFLAKGPDNKQNWTNMRARLCVRCIVDEAGNRLFEDKDVDYLGAKNACALDRIFAVAQRLSGIGKKDLEDLTKNSSKGQSENSISD